ncbi:MULTISPECIES: hypothetical protein [Aeromonas]|uniref:Uncharacterized protein n=1 Tax=Aeromonas veronii TaxID=654 RepID=A0A4S5CGG6_AERVE|nr:MULTISPECIES: hypothetical protein [Aeromonas]THJ44954.1 hypothetical protein E8Q35_12250 [Aeromonas veronii]
MAMIKRKPEIDMTAKNLQIAFYQAHKDRFELLVANVVIKRWLECDLIGVRRNGQVEEVEIKLSRSDFKADFDKIVPMKAGQPGAQTIQEGHLTLAQAKKHDLLASGLSPINFFWFMAPKGLLSADDIPAHAGLIEVTRTGSLQVTVVAPLLHKHKADDTFRVNCLRQQCWRVWDFVMGRRE